MFGLSAIRQVGEGSKCEQIKLRELPMSHDLQSPSTTPVKDRQSQLPQPLLPTWRLWVPLLLQTGLILAVPAQAFYTQITGKTVILKTIPVDPYDPLRGYSQTLNYEISRVDNLRSLPGWQELVKQQAGTRLYVILEAPESAKSQPLKRGNQCESAAIAPLLYLLIRLP